MISDPNILYSMMNMKLRDGAYESLDDLCLSLGLDRGELERKLGEAGYVYDASGRQFRAR